MFFKRCKKQEMLLASKLSKESALILDNRIYYLANSKKCDRNKKMGKHACQERPYLILMIFF